MRIIAGTYRGTRLAEVGKGDLAAHLRPTPDRVRESLFSVLQAHVDWAGLQVLDLFAGTGALGLEALSRGAARAVFVENGRTGHRLIAENVGKLRVVDQVTLLRRDATRLGQAVETFGLVFLDPPYGQDLGGEALRSARKGGWLTKGAIVAWEEAVPQIAPDGFLPLDQRRYGDSYVTLLQTI